MEDIYLSKNLKEASSELTITRYASGTNLRGVYKRTLRIVEVGKLTIILIPYTLCKMRVKKATFDVNSWQCNKRR